MKTLSIPMGPPGTVGATLFYVLIPVMQPTTDLSQVLVMVELRPAEDDSCPLLVFESGWHTNMLDATKTALEFVKKDSGGAIITKAPLLPDKLN